MATDTVSVKVTGLRELRTALKAMDRDLGREVDQELKGIATAVADEARSRFSAIDPRSASGFKARLRGFGRVAVEQTRRSTHTRPDYGAMQMTRALIPAVWAKADDTERALENMITTLAFKHGF
jgi:D-aminopeptidase